jgi:hypothetical protein
MMQKVDLIAASLDELGGELPARGAEVVLGGVRYRVLSVTSLKARTARPARRRTEAEVARWKLLVRTVATWDANGEKR